MNFGKLTFVARNIAGALRNVMGRLALSALSFNAHHATAADAPMTCTPANTEVAVRRLQAKVQEAQLYTAWTQAQCLQFYPEHCDQAKVDITIRELHSPACGGDPHTGPMVDRFRVFRKSGRVLWWNAADDEYIDFAQARDRRKR